MSRHTEADQAARAAAAAAQGQNPQAADKQPPLGLVPLGDYRSPGMPAEHVVRALWRRLKERMGSSNPDPVRSASRLEDATLQALDEVVGPPACGPLLDDFDAAVRAWLDEPNGSFHCVVVLPPCDSTDVIGSWAQSRGLAVLGAPERDQGHVLSLVAGTVSKAHDSGADRPEQSPAFTPEGKAPLLVIPRLEAWFLRRRNGLLAVRALLAELQQAERRCLIGCNSWAWAFLVRAAGAALVLPGPRTFVAFDAQRLHAWFSELAAPLQQGGVAFRLASNGADVLATKDGGALASNYLSELAARSNGIPWVAWHLWRDALRTGIDASQNGKEQEQEPERPSESQSQSTEQRTGAPVQNGVQDGKRTFWIMDVPDPDLPHHQDDNALLVLHALLMHGALRKEELLSVLPDATAVEVLPALLRTGFLAQREGWLSVQPAAYPAVRRALLADGFPMGEI
ncbi:MAG: hypothetical protein KAY08_03095 [Giesbergeria sp.]|nr:hypothetical protein [Giesbergeria sp.]